RVMEEINGLNVSVRTDVHGAVNVRSAGQFAYVPPSGTVRPSMIPDYVSPLNGVPAGPFFMPPKAEVKSGYLYMRILSVEDIEGDPTSLYFVIRNGIDTLATSPVGIDGPGGTTINQEFRILTDPNVSITMWMRFRSDAIIHRGLRGGRGMLGEPGCVPPLLRRLIRRNTRSRGGRWQCQSSADSVFDFDGSQSRFAPGARRAGPPSRGDGYPDRVSSHSGVGSRRMHGAGAQQSHSGYNDPRSMNATQAPSSVFYEPGVEPTGPSASSKGLAQAQFREETRGVAVVHVGEMIEEVFLRGLVDSWDVENVWESRRGAQMNLQLFFIPECPLFREEELPRTLSECEMAMEVCAFHNRTLNSGYMSQRGGDTRFWRRRYFRLIGGFLFAYHEESKEPRCFIDLNDATRVVDTQPERGPRTGGMGAQLGTTDLMRSQRMRRQRPGSHQRNRSDALMGGRGVAAAHEYASDSEPADAVDIADPELQRATLRRPRRAGGAGMSRATDSGIVSGGSTDGAPDNGMQHSFAIEFGAGGMIEFYTETEKEKRLWVEIVKRVVGRIPKIPSWLIKLLHADVSDRIDGSGQLGSDPSLGNASTPSSRFEELTHPHPHLRA
ncbi:Bud site selection protein bud4, partial [Coemansia spiralis]